jgi:hypothetical protein
MAPTGLFAIEPDTLPAATHAAGVNGIRRRRARLGSMQDRGRAFGALGPREWPPRIDRFRIDLLIPCSPMSLPSSALPAGFIAPCLPSSAPQPPSGEVWLHEIKHDGFRVIARKDGNRVKLYSRPRPSPGCARAPASSTARRSRAVMTASRRSTASAIAGTTRASSSMPST